MEEEKYIDTENVTTKNHTEVVNIVQIMYKKQFSGFDAWMPEDIYTRLKEYCNTNTQDSIKYSKCVK